VKLPIAKSYQGLEIIKEPYKVNGKMYVLIKTKSGTDKQVRWYSETEYSKMYPNETDNKSKDPYFKPQKYVLGFEKGYITIFKGVKPEHEEWFDRSICRWAKWWGWYVPSTQKVPEDLPSGVQPVRLDWNGMGNEQDRLCEEKIVIAHVAQTLKKVIAQSSISKYQGSVGDRIEREVAIVQKIEEETRYGKSFEYIMKDIKGNCYKWKTTAKDWFVGDAKTLRGTVKDFGEYEGEELTILTRCMER
jgi:hypothetical protein